MHTKDDLIWVNDYRRIRNGRVEQVKGHWRRKKRRKSATVIPFPHPSVA